ncbi:MAG: ExbD/TolR family protein [Gammaproteobacteria bacterium]
MSPAQVIEREEDASDINLTPMLDVVFIMLVFFIVTSSFVRELGVPATTTDDTSTDKSPDPTSIVVRIDDENEIFIDDRRIDPAALRANLIRLHTEHPKFPVVILPSNSSTTQTLVRVIDSAMQADISDVAVAEVAANRH